MELSFPPLSPCSSCNSQSPKSIPPSSEASRCEHSGRECEEEVTSPALLPHQINGADSIAKAPIEAGPDPTVSIRPSHPSDRGKTAVGKSRKPQRTSSSSFLRQRRARVVVRRRISPCFCGRSGNGSLDHLALPLGMSIAAVISQVLERNDVAAGRISADHLSMICTSAVRESLESVFGGRFDTFMRNFGNSFGSTLKTLRLLKEASLDEQQNSFCTQYATEDISEQAQPAAPCTDELPAVLDEIHAERQSTSMDHQLILHRQITQELADVSNGTFGSRYGQSVLGTFEKSVIEQVRSNDLKEFEIALVMKKLQLKESQLALTSYANLLERFKISMGISKASFKEEKLKTQLQDTRHAELLKKCIDCLVAGLLIMSTCLFYGTYIYSYERISGATVSCSSPPQGSKSWWLPNPMASVSSGLHTLRCHVMVVSRMLFGLLMILALAYSLLQRSASSTQTMPVTFILMLLGVACGFAGKLCVDTLGGSGYIWLLYWEAFCSLHFFANVFTSALFYVLHGPVSVSQDSGQVRFPYWIRRLAFYSNALLVLPILCGLMPFASLHDWKEHFSSLTADKLLDPLFGDGS